MKQVCQPPASGMTIPADATTCIKKSKFKLTWPVPCSIEDSTIMHDMKQTMQFGPAP